MPRAQGQKYHYQDQDSQRTRQVPPVQNTWYEVFHDQDVRLIWCTIEQENDETVAKTCEVRWTIDGNVYVEAASIAHNTLYFVYRGQGWAAGGIALYVDSARRNAAYSVDKRGQDFKVEVRITDAPGTNQILESYCAFETLELT